MEAIHIVGAGGIGCAVGYALAESGPVVFVEASPEKIAHGRRFGVAVNGLPARPAEFVSFADWDPPADAVVLLCTKCYDNAAVLARLGESARLVPIQNGFDPALLDRPPHVEGIASFVSECIPGQTHTRITRAGRLHLGLAGQNPSPNPSPQRRGEPEVSSPPLRFGEGAGGRGSSLTPPLRFGEGAGGRGSSGAGESCLPRPLALLQELAGRLRRAPFRVMVVPNILPYKYTKLMYNAALSPLASAAGIDNGAMLRRKDVRSLFFALLRENHAILTRAGAPLGKVGPLHPDTVARILGRPWLAHALAWAFYPSLSGTYCSMANDLPAGRTEIENYNGHLITLASGGPCPLNRRVYSLVKRMEQQRLPPALERLKELAAVEAGQEQEPQRDDYTRFAG